MTRQRARPTTKADECEAFREFWAAWRPNMNKNDGRGAARDEFYRHVSYGADAQDITDGAKWFLHNGGNAGEYRVHASTWINRRAYEDGAELWREFQARMQQKQAQASENVVSMPRTVRPKNHFLNKWEEQKRQGA